MIETMPLTYKAKTLTMGFCLSCHRNPAPHLRPAAAVYDTAWTRGPETPSPMALMQENHVPDRELRVGHAQAAATSAG